MADQETTQTQTPEQQAAAEAREAADKAKEEAAQTDADHDAGELASLLNEEAVMEGEDAAESVDAAGEVVDEKVEKIDYMDYFDESNFHESSSWMLALHRFRSDVEQNPENPPSDSDLQAACDCLTSNLLKTKPIDSYIFNEFLVDIFSKLKKWGGSPRVEDMHKIYAFYADKVNAYMLEDIQRASGVERQQFSKKVELKLRTWRENIHGVAVDACWLEHIGKFCLEVSSRGFAGGESKQLNSHYLVISDRPQDVDKAVAYAKNLMESYDFNGLRDVLRDGTLLDQIFEYTVSEVLNVDHHSYKKLLRAKQERRLDREFDQLLERYTDPKREIKEDNLVSHLNAEEVRIWELGMREGVSYADQKKVDLLSRYLDIKEHSEERMDSMISSLEGDRDRKLAEKPFISPDDRKRINGEFDSQVKAIRERSDSYIARQWEKLRSGIDDLSKERRDWELDMVRRGLLRIQPRNTGSHWVDNLRPNPAARKDEIRGEAVDFAASRFLENLNMSHEDYIRKEVFKMVGGKDKNGKYIEPRPKVGVPGSERNEEGGFKETRFFGQLFRKLVTGEMAESLNKFLGSWDSIYTLLYDDKNGQVPEPNARGRDVLAELLDIAREHTDISSVIDLIDDVCFEVSNQAATHAYLMNHDSRLWRQYMNADNMAFGVAGPDGVAEAIRSSEFKRYFATAYFAARVDLAKTVGVSDMGFDRSTRLDKFDLSFEDVSIENIAVNNTADSDFVAEYFRQALDHFEGDRSRFLESLSKVLLPALNPDQFEDIQLSIYSDKPDQILQSVLQMLKDNGFSSDELMGLYKKISARVDSDDPLDEGFAQLTRLKSVLGKVYNTELIEDASSAATLRGSGIDIGALSKLSPEKLAQIQAMLG